MKLITTLVTFLSSFFLVKAQNAPVFTNTSTQTFDLCYNSANNSLSKYLVTADIDTNQTLTYTLLTAPKKGTVVGLPSSLNTVNGGSFTPQNIYYTPNTNYIGYDTVQIKVTDGTFSAVKKIILYANSPVSIVISGKSNVCLGSSQQLTVNTNTGAWSSGNTGIATISSTGLISPLAVGTTVISYAVTDAYACTYKSSVTVTVDTVPVVTGNISGSTSFCAGTKSIYTHPTAGGRWSSSNTTVVTIDSITGVATGKLGGDANIMYSIANAQGCKGYKYYAVHINEKPTVAANTSPGTNLCVGSYANAYNNSIVTGTSSWRSTNISIATVNNSGLIYGLAVGIDTIIFKSTTPAGCSDSAITLFTVSTPPVMTPIVGPYYLCLNDSTQFTCSPPGGTWFSTAGYANLGFSSTGKVLAKNLTYKEETLSYVYQGASACAKTESVKVYIVDKPNVPAIQGPSIVCVNSKSNFTNTLPGGKWYSLNTNKATIDSLGNVTGKDTGTAVIKYEITNNYGCTSFTTTTISIANAIVLPAIQGPSNTCAGTNVTLTNSKSGGVWSSSDFTIATVVNGTVYCIKEGVVNIKYTMGSGGCMAFVSKNVKVNPTPIVPQIQGNSIICTNALPTYKDSLAGGVWTSSDTALLKIDSTGKVYFAKEFYMPTVTYTVSNSFGCSGAVFLNTHVYKPTNNTIYGKTSICLGKTTNLFLLQNSGTWTVSDTNIATLTDNHNGSCIVFGKSSGSAIVYSYYNDGFCAQTTQVKITVMPHLYIDTIVTAPLCMGTTAIFTNATSPGSGLWATSDTNIAKIDTSGNKFYQKGYIKPKALGTVTIYYYISNGTGCRDTSRVTVQVNSIPTVGAIVGPSTICINDTLQFTNPTNPGGIWTPSGYGAMHIDSFSGKAYSNFYTVIDTIRYTYTSPTTGCKNTVSKKISFNINGPALGTTTGNTNVCEKTTSQFSNTTSGGRWYVYWEDTGYIKIDSITGLLTGIKSTASITGGTATIVYTKKNITGCASAKQTSVKVLPIISPQPTYGVNKLCVGVKTILKNYNATKGKWYSSNVTIATVDSLTGEVTAVSGGVCNINYVVPNTNGCSTITNHTLTVNALPVVNSISAPLNSSGLCIGNTLQLTTTSTGGLWSISNPAIASINSTGIISGITSGEIVVSYTINLNGCSNSSFWNGQIYNLPKIATVSGSAYVCLNSTQQLANDSSGGIWQSSNSSIISVTNSGIISGLSVGNASISYKKANSFGCVTTATKLIEVKANPSAGVLSTSYEVCVGQSRSIASTISGGVWSVDSNNLATINQSSGLVNGIKTGFAQIKYLMTDNFGCKDSTYASLNVIALPSILPITGVNNICRNASSYLYNNVANGVWKSANTGIITVNQNGLITSTGVVGSTTIRYVVTNTKGCMDSTNYVINVGDNTTIPNITGVTTVCKNDSTTFANTLNNGIWSVNNSSKGVIDSNGKFIANDSGNVQIRYTYTNSFNCATTAFKNLYINSLPNVDSIFGLKDVCLGIPSTYTNLTSSGIWSVSNTNLASVTTNGILQPIQTGNIFLKYMIVDAKSCKNIAVKNIVIQNLPYVAPIEGSSSVCLGGSTKLFDSTFGGVWTSGNSNAATIDSTGLINGINLGTSLIKYFYTNSFGCTNASIMNITVSSQSLNGVIYNVNRSKDMNNVSLILSGFSNGTKTVNKKFNLDCLPSNAVLTIKARKNNDIIKANGVTSTDVLLTQRHILGTSKLNSAFKIIAADVTGDKQINSVDILRMKRLILGSDTTFTSITRGSRLWEFVDSAYVFPDTTNPFPFKDSIFIDNNSVNKNSINFIATKLGDVNYDWNPSFARYRNVELGYSILKEVNSTFTIKISTLHIENLAALQSTIHFDNNRYEFVGIKNGKIDIDFNATKANENGNISFLWTDKNGQTKSFEGKDDLFEIYFKPRSTKLNSFELELNGDITNSIATDENLNERHIQLSKIGEDQLNSGSVCKLNVYPNPSTGNIFLETLGVSEIMITDFFGRVITQKNIPDFRKSSININLSKGVYFVKCVGKKESLIHKVFVE